MQMSRIRGGAATLLIAGALVGTGFSIIPARADETISIGGSSAVLLRPASPRGSGILMPGSHGSIGTAADGQITRLQGNSLVRNRASFRARGLAVLVVDGGVNLASAVEYMAKIKRPVVVIASSRGTLRAARGIAGGAQPDALVLASGYLTDASGSSENVANILGSSAALPRTLVIHHRRDGCRVTQPAGVDPFIRWAGGRARVVWVDGGREAGDPCQAEGHHGFAGIDGRLVSLAAGFR
ncbi:MAG TPA: alpha/beta hydrolase [Beijerinckiaceae bacterium]